MKKVYNSPTVEVVELQSEDIITVSGGTGFANSFTIGEGINAIEF